jgi:hypothetical protein
MRHRFLPRRYPTQSAIKMLKIISQAYFVLLLLPLFLFTFCKSVPKLKRSSAEGSGINSSPELEIRQEPALQPSTIIEDTRLPEDLLREGQPAADAFPEMEAAETAGLLPAKLIGKWGLSPKSLALSTEQIPLYFELLSNHTWQGETARLSNSKIGGGWNTDQNYLTLKNAQQESPLTFVIVYVSDLYLVLRPVDAPSNAKIVYSKK